MPNRFTFGLLAGALRALAFSVPAKADPINNATPPRNAKSPRLAPGAKCGVSCPSPGQRY